MSERNKIIELLPPRNPELPPLQLSPGKFYRSRGNDIWCCFQKIDDTYHCIRTPDNVISLYRSNGLERYAKDDSSEHTLIGVYHKRRVLLDRSQLEAFGASLLQQINSAVELLDAWIASAEMTYDALAEAKFRIEYLRKELGKVANASGFVPHVAQDALLWLEDREQNHFKLGDNNAVMDTQTRGTHSSTSSSR